MAEVITLFVLVLPVFIYLSNRVDGSYYRKLREMQELISNYIRKDILKHYLINSLIGTKSTYKINKYKIQFLFLIIRI